VSDATPVWGVVTEENGAKKKIRIRNRGGVSADTRTMGADKGATARALDQSPEAIEASLAASLRAATEAARWDLAAMLARELQARRLPRLDNVVPIGGKKPRRL
jgi:hypothetical protein